MEYDLKLLQDICPYTSAYGHTLRNYVYNYTYGVACINLGGNETDKIITEYYERCLRSFLVTKNLDYSAKLVKKDMNNIYNEQLLFSNFSWDDVKKDQEKMTNWYKEIEKEHITNKTFKNRINVSAEWYELNYTEGNIAEPLFKICDDHESSWITTIKFSDTLSLQFLVYCTGIYDRTEKFDVAIYRHKHSSTPIRCGLFDAVRNFPELIGTNEWKKNE